MDTIHLLLVLGGAHHDFAAYAQTIQPVLSAQGIEVETTYDFGRLERLGTGSVDVVLMYTCRGSENRAKGDDGPLSPEQVHGLTDWVRHGGGLVAAHAATVSAQSDIEVRRLMGGAFVSHPPRFAYTVYPTYRPHPITEGVEAFTIHDEFYVQEYEETIDIHMVGVDRGIAYPLVWSRPEGTGLVAHVAPGHGPLVWNAPAYQRLMVQAVQWVAGRS